MYDRELKIAGYINKSHSMSCLLKNNDELFVESISRGAFTRAINRADNIPMLLNHNKGIVLASTKDKTLILKEDNSGLYFEAKIYCNNELVYCIKNNYLHFSFGFTAINERFRKDFHDVPTRYIDDLYLHEVSLLKGLDPAYPKTSIWIK